MLVGQKVVLLTAMDVDPGVLPQRVLDLLRQSDRRRARGDSLAVGCRRSRLVADSRGGATIG